MIDDHHFSFQPRELKIVVTGACDLTCRFCYQNQPGSDFSRHATDDQIMAWIDWAVDNRLPTVRFTGGEPTLHPNIKLFANYAHLRGRRLIINTNGLASAGLYADLLRMADIICLSLPTLDPDLLDRVSGGRGVLEKKLAFLAQAQAAGVPVSLLTVLLPENKGRLEGFARLARRHPGVIWVPLRLKPTPRHPRPWLRRDAQDFAEEVADLMDRYPRQLEGISWSMPFCAVQPLELGARVFKGRAEHCGPHHSLAVGLDGVMRACYGGASLPSRPLTDLARDPVLGELLLPDHLPPECRACSHLDRCAGGCRNQLGLVEHRGGLVDHLAGFLTPDAPGWVARGRAKA